MNVREAREKIAGAEFGDKDGYIAEGYLEAVEKAKVLEKFVSILDCACDSYHDYPCKRCKALSAYRKTI